MDVFGATMADQTFRLMDPDSHRMMGLRADMTLQAARVATTRLAHWPRPLRVSYAGPSLRAQSAGVAAERQIAQAGIELIGHDSPEADAEATVAAIRSAWARAPGVSAASNRTANPLYMLNAAAMAAHFHCSRPQCNNRRPNALPYLNWTLKRRRRRFRPQAIIL
jgi:hypothetical protein